MSCSAAQYCAAVGGYETSTGKEEGLIETLTDGVWTTTETDGGFGSVSCTAPGSCVAVGAISSFVPVIATLSSGSWTSLKAPLPADADKDNLAGLNSVSCASAAACVAAGYYELPVNNGVEGDVVEGFTESLKQGKWIADAVPAVKDHGGVENAYLDTVSCGDATNCVAAGVSQSCNCEFGWNYGLLDTLSGGRWSQQTAPLPAATPPSDPDVWLSSASCVESSCTVVGDTKDEPTGVIDTLAKGVWTGLLAPLPKPVPSDPTPSLAAVSCVTTGCVAVGSFNHGALVDRN